MFWREKKENKKRNVAILCSVRVRADAAEAGRERGDWRMGVGAHEFNATRGNSVLRACPRWEPSVRRQLRNETAACTVLLAGPELMRYQIVTDCLLLCKRVGLFSWS